MWLLVLCSRKLRVSLLWLVHSCPQHTHDTHTPCGFLSVWTLCSPSVWFDLIFPLSHLISIPPSLSVRTGKKQGPPENRNKGNPSIHPSVPLCPPPSLLLTLSSPSTQRQEGSVQSISISLSLLYQGGTFSRLALPVTGCNSQPSKSLTANHSVHSCHGNCHSVTMGLYVCLNSESVFGHF